MFTNLVVYGNIIQSVKAILSVLQRKLMKHFPELNDFGRPLFHILHYAFSTVVFNQLYTIHLALPHDSSIILR